MTTRKPDNPNTYTFDRDRQSSLPADFQAELKAIYKAIERNKGDRVRELVAAAAIRLKTGHPNYLTAVLFENSLATAEEHNNGGIMADIFAASIDAGVPNRMDIHTDKLVSIMPYLTLADLARIEDLKAKEKNIPKESITYRIEHLESAIRGNHPETVDHIYKRLEPTLVKDPRGSMKNLLKNGQNYDDMHKRFAMLKYLGDTFCSMKRTGTQKRIMPLAGLMRNAIKERTQDSFDYLLKHSDFTPNTLMNLAVDAAENNRLGMLQQLYAVCHAKDRDILPILGAFSVAGIESETFGWLLERADIEGLKDIKKMNSVDIFMEEDARAIVAIIESQKLKEQHGLKRLTSNKTNPAL